MARAYTPPLRQLRKEGFFARGPFMCCQSCGCAAIPDEKQDSYVFFHAQDLECFLKDGELWLAWNGDGARIVEVFEQHGFDCEWDGSKSTRIKATIKTLN